MPDKLSKQFTEDMIENYRCLVRECDYRADQFLHVVTMLGGVEAANQLLDFAEPPGGFQRLKKINQLHRSVEAWVLLPRYRNLFTEVRRKTAYDRLTSAGFDVDEFVALFSRGSS